MTRARGTATRTSARRRVHRYRAKWSSQVIPERLKTYLHDPPHQQWELLKPELEEYVDVETPVEDELTIKGVPAEEWPYYMGFSKRMLELYWSYTGATLELEKTNLIEEYKLRGYQEHILLQLQDRVHFEGYFKQWIFENWNYPDPPSFQLYQREYWSF